MSATELSFTGEWQKKDWPEETTQDATERGTFVLALHGPEEVVRAAGRTLTLTPRVSLSTLSLEHKTPAQTKRMEKGSMKLSRFSDD